MDSYLKTIFWKQFGASIDMLENAIAACPGDLWDGEAKFWLTNYHTLFFLDYYLSKAPESFSPPEPFRLSELDPSGLMPERVYNKEELLTYLNICRQKCHDFIRLKF